MPVSRRSWRSCSRVYSASVKAESVLRRVRPGKHSKRKRRPQSHWARSARGRKSSGASSRPNHFRIVKGAVGLAQGSEWLTEICPPFAKLVPSAGSGWRSTTVTSWPLCARYHALVVPITPAPRTTTLTLASEKTKGGKLAPSPPLPCPSPVYSSDYELRFWQPQLSGIHSRGNESTLSTSARQASSSPCTGVTPMRPGSLFPGVGNHFLPLLTQTLDAKGDHVTRLQPCLGRLHPQRHPGRGSGGNDVAGEQCHVVAHVRHKLRAGENHVLGIGRLPAFAVDVEPDVERLRIGYLVGRDEPWPDRPEGVTALALVPLRGLQLERALGYVVHDGKAGNTVQRLVLRHIFGAGPNDDCDLDLIVELGGVARLLDVVVRTVDARRRRHENDRLGGYLQTRFVRVIGVIQTDGDELGDARIGHAETRVAAHQGQRLRTNLAQLRQTFGGNRVLVDVG